MKRLDAMILVRLTKRQKGLIKYLAHKDRRTLGSWVRNVLEDHVKGLRRA